MEVHSMINESGDRNLCLSSLFNYLITFFEFRNGLSAERADLSTARAENAHLCLKLLAAFAIRNQQQTVKLNNSRQFESNFGDKNILRCKISPRVIFSLSQT